MYHLSHLKDMVALSEPKGIFEWMRLLERREHLYCLDSSLIFFLILSEQYKREEFLL